LLLVFTFAYQQLSFFLDQDTVTSLKLQSLLFEFNSDLPFFQRLLMAPLLLDSLSACLFRDLLQKWHGAHFRLTLAMMPLHT
jgi:hypothetical protein